MTKFLAAVTVASALSGGCSVAFQNKPTAGHVATSECSKTSAYWIADTVGAVAGIGAGTATVIATGADGSDSVMAAAYAGAFAGLLYLASAHNGYKWARQCNETAPVSSVAAR